jgi:uncharacterized protein HemX
MEQNQMPGNQEVRVTPVVVPPTPAKTSYGALFGIFVIAVAVAAGAYYFFNQRVDELVQITEDQQAAIAALDTQSESTEPEAIEADLAAESPDEFDAEMESAFASLEAAFSAQ